MKTFSSMRRDFLRTGGVGVAVAAIPMVHFRPWRRMEAVPPPMHL